MNKREAKRIAEEDTTRYGVFSRGKAGASLSTVTGYRNAKIVKGKDADAVILTESEIKKVRGGWRP